MKTKRNTNAYADFFHPSSCYFVRVCELGGVPLNANRTSTMRRSYYLRSSCCFLSWYYWNYLS
jgi:hypothetical protein